MVLGGQSGRKKIIKKKFLPLELTKLLGNDLQRSWYAAKEWSSRNCVDSRCVVCSDM